MEYPQPCTIPPNSVNRNQDISDYIGVDGKFLNSKSTIQPNSVDEQDNISEYGDVQASTQDHDSNSTNI